jgi:hypothetical protein
MPRSLLRLEEIMKKIFAYIIVILILFFAHKNIIYICAYSAISKDDPVLLNKLRMFGLNLNDKDPETETSLLMNAVDKRAKKCALFLINTDGVDLNWANQYHGYKCINVALINKDTEICKILVDKKCDLDFSDKHGRHLLSLALQYKNYFVVKKIVEVLKSKNKLHKVMTDSNLTSQDLEVLKGIEREIE